MVQPVVIGDSGSLARSIQPTDYTTGWKTSGAPDQAVALDSGKTFLRSAFVPFSPPLFSRMRRPDSRCKTSTSMGRLPFALTSWLPVMRRI